MTLFVYQILTDMIAELDVNGDGYVSFEEWRRSGQANVPLIVLLGFDEVHATFIRQGSLSAILSVTRVWISS